MRAARPLAAAAWRRGLRGAPSAAGLWGALVLLEAAGLVALVGVVPAATRRRDAEWLHRAPAGDLRLSGEVSPSTLPTARPAPVPQPEARTESELGFGQPSLATATRTLPLEAWQRAIGSAWDAERGVREEPISAFAGSASGTGDDEELGVGGLSDWVGDAATRAAGTAIVADEQREWIFNGRRHPYRGGWDGNLDPRLWNHDAYDAAVVRAADERRDAARRRRAEEARRKAAEQRRQREAQHAKAEANFMESLNDGWDTATIDSSEVADDDAGDDAGDDAAAAAAAAAAGGGHAKRGDASKARLGIGIKGTRFFQLDLRASAGAVKSTADRIENSQIARAIDRQRSASARRSRRRSGDAGGPDRGSAAAGQADEDEDAPALDEGAPALDEGAPAEGAGAGDAGSAQGELPADEAARLAAASRGRSAEDAMALASTPRSAAQLKAAVRSGGKGGRAAHVPLPRGSAQDAVALASQVAIAARREPRRPSDAAPATADDAEGELVVHNGRVRGAALPTRAGPAPDAAYRLRRAGAQPAARWAASVDGDDKARLDALVRALAP